MVLTSKLLSITEEVHEFTSHRAISAYVVYYSKFDQKVNVCSKALTEWSLTRT